MHEQVHHCDETANHQLPIATAFWIIWIVSRKECSSLTQNSMQICCSTSSVILSVMATEYICSLNGVYHPHWLVQWSPHCSWTHIPVHCPWLPGYTDVVQTIPVMLTMVGLFLDRLFYIYIHICMQWNINENILLCLFSLHFAFLRTNNIYKFLIYIKLSLQHELSSFPWRK